MITIFCIGKGKHAFAKEGVRDYLSRIKKYNPITYIDVQKVPEKKGYWIALDVKGKKYSSETFAQHVHHLLLHHKDVTFVLGDADGIPKTVLDNCDENISLSTMTMQHDLARLFFIEQLYRAFTILHHEPYHK